MSFTSTPGSYPLPAPPWATRSVHEDGGITHETVSAIHPHVIDEWPARTEPGRPVELSISVVDRRMGGRWTRSEPTVQIEGGAFPLSEIPDLVRALLDIAALPSSGTTPLEQSSMTN